MRTPNETEEKLVRWEKRIACHMFSDVLQVKKIPHKVVYGHTVDGMQDHVWIIASGKNYDMMRQGFSKKFEVWYSYSFSRN